MFQAKKTAVDPKQFADMLGIPFSSLLMLMKEHHERDPLVKQSLHEHVSFIKIQEGYPVFVYDTAIKTHNKVRLTQESKEIGILDFYESLSIMPKVVAAIQTSCQELQNVHNPDNGFMQAATDVVTLSFLLAELKGVRAEQRGHQVSQGRDLDLVQDDSILGNADKMLFHTKELVATIEDPKLTQNPFVMTKLDLDSINEFDFDRYQTNDPKRPFKGASALDGESSDDEKKKKFSPNELSDGSMEKDIEDIYEKGFGLDESDDDDFAKKQQLHEHGKSVLHPRLKAKKFRANIPSMLVVMCNAVEAMRLRHILADAMIQRDSLLEILKE
jgi:hypothetical protein